jgi:hypothetical protein
LLFHYSPLGWLYVSLNSKNIYEQAVQAAPEFDKLNDELMQSLPIYPRATSLPQIQARRGPGPYDGAFAAGPSGPRTLSVCFATDDSMEQVAAFYHHTLKADGWKPVRVSLFKERYTKNQACIDLYSQCFEVESDARTVYRVKVFYDLNVLLPFPGLPKVWDGGVSRCP